MIVRLVLALLLALAGTLSGTAPANCHDPAMAAMPMAMPGAPTTRHDPRPPSPEHGCIGCAALADWLAERVVAPLIVTTAAPLPIPARWVAGVSPPPRLRPPRLG